MAASSASPPLFAQSAFVATLALVWVPESEARGCLSVRHNKDSLEVKYGDPKVDSFCTFAVECFDLKCPLPGDGVWPMSFEDFDEEEFPADACRRLRKPECVEGFKRAEEDCAADDIARRIWIGQQRGLCVRCQRLVEAYRRLQARCPMMDNWKSTLMNALAEFADEDSFLDSSGKGEI
mmetsp:Transcript_88361/g.248915  ORF Transcript_88361/g.248915 Transcript_88361/m.248915 type:complete len:179 (+) Transcript_88361:70-606(+)